jgi:PKHD-type hydroxylase
LLWETFQYALVLRNAFSISECEALISEAQRNGLHDGQLGTVRRCDIAWVDSPDLTAPIADIGFNSLYGERFGLARPFVGSTQISRYASGGEYGWHMDLGAGAMSLRKATVVVELRSASKGGGLEVFAIGDLGLQVGDAAIFPSFIMHRAKPVVSGERWSATEWLLGTEPFN